MRMRPEAMERWGVRSIVIEAARLLDNHFGLFLPFFLIFHLPASMLGAFQVVVLKVALPHASVTLDNFFKAFSSRRQEDVYVDADSQPSLAVMMSICALGLAIFILNTLALSALAYIVNFIYSEAGTKPDDDRIIKKVFKLLPRAVLRLFVTNLWWYLGVNLLTMACVTLAIILNVTWTAIAGGESGPSLALCLLFAGVPFIIGLFAMSVMFIPASWITVLEPENYGLAALKVSTKYVRGSFSTSIAISLVAFLYGWAGYFDYLNVLIREEMTWLKITESILRAIIYGLVVGFILDVVCVVTYFVLKSKFEAALPETIQRGSIIPAPKNPYQRLVYDSTQPKSIDEPLS